MDPLSRVAILETSTAGASSAMMAAAAMPVAFEKMRLVKPYTDATVTTPRAAESSRRPASPPMRSASDAIAGHRYQPKLHCSGVSRGASKWRLRNMRP